MRIITRGYGKYNLIITRGYGRSFLEDFFNKIIFIELEEEINTNIELGEYFD